MLIADSMPRTFNKKHCSGQKIYFQRFLLLWSSAKWQIYDKLFCQLLQSSASLFKVMQYLLVMLLSICRRFRPLVVLPNILPSIMSQSSESCLKVCPIHLSLRCCTVSKMFLFSWTLCSTSLFDTLSTQLILYPFFSKPTFQKLTVFLYQLLPQHHKEQRSTHTF